MSLRSKSKKRTKSSIPRQKTQPLPHNTMTTPNLETISSEDTSSLSLTPSSARRKTSKSERQRFSDQDDSYERKKIMRGRSLKGGQYVPIAKKEMAFKKRSLTRKSSKKNMMRFSKSWGELIVASKNVRKRTSIKLAQEKLESCEMRDGMIVDRHTDEIIGATMSGIVYLIVFEEMDSEESLRKILLSHKKFFDSEELVDELGKLLKMDHGMLLDLTVKSKVVSVLQYWMKFFAIHFDDALILAVESVIGFLQNETDLFSASYSTVLTNGMLFVHKELEHLNEQKNFEIHKDFEFKGGDIVHTDVSQLAKELTILQTQSFGSVNLESFFYLGLSQTDTFFLESVSISNWVMAECLLCAEYTASEQTEVLSYFITLCNYLKDLGNYNSYFFIYSALAVFEVEKLPGWTLLSEKMTKKWRRIERLCNPTKNFKFINDMQTAFADSLTVPLLPTITQTIIRYDETVENRIEDDYFNLTKMDLFNETYQKLCSYKKELSEYSNETIKELLKTRLEKVKDVDFLKSLGIYI